MTILIASNRPFPGRKVEDRRQLDLALDALNPKIVFFPYWSWRVPMDLFVRYVCIGFHTGDTAGGSPIQHLIRQGKEESYIKMFYMTHSLDGGEEIERRRIYLHGSLEEIVIRQTEVMKGMIDDFCKKDKEQLCKGK